MEMFPYCQLSRGYTLGTPRWRPIDSGVASMMLGDGVMRTRPELPGAVYAIELRLDGLTEADAALLWSFYSEYRSEAFWWMDPKTGPLSQTACDVWECVFDPTSCPQILPHDDMYDRYHADIVLRPTLPIAPVPMLAAHYLMDDNAADKVVADAGTYGNDGASQQNTSALTAAGKIGTALTFNGSTDYVTVASSDSLNVGTGDFTLFCWIKTSYTGGHQQLISKRNVYPSGSWSLGYNFYIVSDGRLVLFSNDGTSYGAVSHTPAASIRDGAWHAVGVTVDRDGNSYFIVDGVLSSAKDVSAVAGSLDTSVSLVIGQWASASWFNGVMDDVRVYRRALSSGEIASIYNAGAGTQEAVIE